MGRLDDWDNAESIGAPDPALEAIRLSLLERLRLAREQQADLLSRRVDQGARPQYGKRIGDHTTEAVEHRTQDAIDASRSSQIAEMERALVKIDRGTYGICDRCYQPIAPERLEALPWAAECVGCRQRRVVARR